MKLDKYKEEIYKCSGCGLCQSSCPVYKILKTECAVSRGKFKLLNAIINKDAKYSKKTLDIMNLCLHCGICNDFCPSGIDAQKIIETAQYDMLNCSIFSVKRRFFALIFTNNFLLNMIKIFVNIIRKLKILDILQVFNCKNLKLLKEFLEIKILPANNKSNRPKTIKALYFKGCVNNYVNPSSQNAVKRIFADTDVEIIDADFCCCGLPLKTSGDFDNFKKLAEKNIKIILENDFDYLIFDCPSCKSTILEYEKYIENEKFEKIKNKIISVYELLEKIDYKIIKNDSKVTMHYPCHIRNTKDIKVIQNLLKQMNFAKMDNADSCCGAAGSFLFMNKKLSEKISEEKAENIINSKADIVLTTCPSCVLGLKQGLLEKNSDIKVMELIEFLAK